MSPTALDLLLRHSHPFLTGVTPHVFRMILHVQECNSCAKTGSQVVREQGLTVNPNARARFPWDFLRVRNQQPFSLSAVTTQTV